MRCTSNMPRPTRRADEATTRLQIPFSKAAGGIFNLCSEAGELIGFFIGHPFPKPGRPPSRATSFRLDLDGSPTARADGLDGHFHPTHIRSHRPGVAWSSLAYGDQRPILPHLCVSYLTSCYGGHGHSWLLEPPPLQPESSANMGPCLAIWLFGLLPVHHQVSGSGIRACRHLSAGQQVPGSLLASLHTGFGGRRDADEPVPLRCRPCSRFPGRRKVWADGVW